jgi:hypothetical protein
MLHEGAQAANPIDEVPPLNRPRAPPLNANERRKLVGFQAETLAINAHNLCLDDYRHRES